MDSPQRPGVLVLDADAIVADAVATALEAAGETVYRYCRDAGLTGPGIVAAAVAQPTDLLAQWEQRRTPINRIVFGADAPASALPERLDLIDALADQIEARLLSFLSELQLAGRLLARRDGAQIWVLTQELSMRYCIAVNPCPIEIRARQAAVKSFAKEMLQLGVVINCASIQPVAEQASEQAWRDARQRLKLYALRFAPARAAEVGRALSGLLLQPRLPMSGLVVPIGFGVAEQNI
jgi:hypothetical protein